jgi:hypothetical protein
MAELAAKFAERRCRCGQPAVVVRPGRDEVRQMFLLSRAVPDRNLCAYHAGLLGNSEAARASSGQDN